MSTVRLENLKPGMVLADAVKDLNGRILLALDTELTEKHLNIFRAWGVTEVSIQDDIKVDNGRSTKPEIDPKRLAQAEKEAKNMFSHTNQEFPPIKELLRLCILSQLQDKPEE